MSTKTKSRIFILLMTVWCGGVFAQQEPAGEAIYRHGVALADEGNVKGALKEFRKAAKMGHAQAICDLGYCYDYALGVKHNVKKAAQLYRKSNIGEGWYRLAVCYLGGELSPKGELTLSDSLEGMACMRRAMAVGEPRAYFAMGRYYFKKADESRQNFDSAVYYFTCIADSQNTDVWTHLAVLYENGCLGEGIDSNLAVYYYRRAAGDGDAHAMMSLGNLYVAGRFVPADSAMAYDYYRRAAELGSEKAFMKVAQCQYLGIGTKADTLAAIESLKAAARMGSGQAALQMGTWYQYGAPYVEHDMDSAAVYYYIGARGDDAECCDRLGDYYAASGETEMAASAYARSAYLGSYQGLFDLALLTLKSIDAKPDDLAQAYNYIRVAALEGEIPSAVMQLGVCHIYGTGCEQDYDAAFGYFKQAASMGNGRAMFNLAMCYEDGLGCKADTAAMLQWLDSAVAHNNIQAVNKLGDFYEAGTYVKQDYERAVELYTYGVEQLGSYESYCNLGYCYESGQGVILNSAKAFRLYKEAADGGYPRGLFCTANCYAEGIGVERDEATAFNYYKAAADAGHRVAQYIVGEVYSTGTAYAGKDKKKAKQYFGLSAAQGYEPAEAALKRL
ncbi:MAG: sel1 repeat family protein [Bacteroidales bacterium]|nr:sel1 repeat family protein [Bacteroidales bacterium]